MITFFFAAKEKRGSGKETSWVCHEFQSSRDVENGLELLHQGPLFHRDFGPVELLEGIDTGTRDAREQLVLLLQVTAVQGLIATLNLDSN